MFSVRNATFDFIQTVSLVDDTTDLEGELFKLLEQFGISSFLSATVPLPGQSCDDQVFLNGWNATWYERYTKKRYFEVDPVIRMMTSSTSPFQWSSAAKIIPPNPEGSLIADEARQFAMNDGITVPIYSRDGSYAGFTFGAELLEVDTERFAALRLIAMYAHEAAKRNVTPGSASTQSEGEDFAPLSPREIDCLSWASLGKTNTEIAQILGLSPRTAEAYFRNIRTKLNATNTVQAVSTAIRNRLI